MNTKKFVGLAFAACFALAGSALAEVMDRPIGIQIGQRMTLKPYVGVSAAYDSNIDGRKDGHEDIMWLISPGLGLEYKGDSWALLASVFYQYADYMNGGTSSASQYEGYGEDLTFRWSDSKPGEKGWSLMLTEKYQKTDQADDIIESSGTSYGQDRDEFKSGFAVERRFTSQLHGNFNASYYWLDYQSHNSYGWTRWQAGGELGFAASPWTDIILAASYQDYSQDNTTSLLSDSSEGETVQVGLGTYATERITYRLLAGWSRFEYGGGNGSTDNGFIYTASGRWLITDTWNTMVQASAFYQPSERENNASQRTDLLSWGIAHSMVRGKLSATGDIAYRRETHEYSADGSYDYDVDSLSFRLGLNYTMNRYLTLFANAEYRRSMADSDSVRGDYYNYNRIRTTIGLRFTY